MSTFNVGDRIRALIDMDSDHTDEGMGIQRYARQGDELIVRGLCEGSRWLTVSHENVTDRSFLVEPDEIELIAAKQSGKGGE